VLVMVKLIGMWLVSITVIVMVLLFLSTAEAVACQTGLIG